MAQSQQMNRSLERRKMRMKKSPLIVQALTSHPPTPNDVSFLS
jgi:hypothetical protein